MGIGRRIPGVLLTLALMILECLFVLLLLKTKLLPVKYIVILCVLLAAVAVVVLFLAWDLKKTWRPVTAVLLTVVTMGCIGAISAYVVKGVSTLGQITEVTVEIAHVGVYVRQDDTAQSINDAGDYVFGILAEQDRDNTDKAIEEIEATLGKDLTVKEYGGLAELVDSILTGDQTQAIVLNSAFIGLLDDMEGYESADEQLREVHVQQVETVIEHVAQSETETEQDVETAEEASPGDSSTFSVYISGIDSRGGLIAKSRSDVNIIATVNTDTRQVLLVSTPRDYYVPLPISGDVPDKLTHAGIYGVDVSIGTLEMLYDMDIDYYFRVNFSGFEGIIDALGGVTVYSEYTFSADGYQFYQGDNQLYGAAALAFARERKAFSSGDRQRGRNQMAMIKAVIDKATSPALLANYTDILDQVSGNFETSIPYDMIAELVRLQLDEGGSWNVISYSVDGTGATRKPYSLSTNAYVMIPDYDTVAQAVYLMEQVRSGAILEE